jgi:hypothetical protein
MFHHALREGLPPPELRTRSMKEVFCSASFCACGGAPLDRRTADGAQRGTPVQSQAVARPAAEQQVMPLVTWEPGVTADVAPDLLRAAPFVYVCDRLYNLSGQPGGFEVEERVLGRCYCKVRHETAWVSGPSSAHVAARAGTRSRCALRKWRVCESDHQQVRSHTKQILAYSDVCVAGCLKGRHSAPTVREDERVRACRIPHLDIGHALTARSLSPQQWPWPRRVCRGRHSQGAVRVRVRGRGHSTRRC